MKTERRHELQTNELSQQIDQLGDYIRKNANRLIAIGSVVIVLVVAVAWYVKSKQARVMDGWATLSDTTLASDPAAAVDRYRSVASESGNTDLTIAAWLRIGETAMSQLFAVLPPDSSSTATSKDEWQKQAQEAYEKVLQLSSARQSTAKGQALMMLGVLAEDRGDFEKAREHYNSIIKNDLYAATPLPMQAEYRLAGLARWSAPVTFPPPSVTAPAPPVETPSVQFDPPPGQKMIMSQTIDVNTGEVVAGDKHIPVRIINEDAPAPTTQPADDGDGN